MDAKYVKYWQHRGAEERTAELVAEFKQGKVIETGPSVDDYEPEPEPEPLRVTIRDESGEIRTIEVTDPELKRIIQGPNPTAGYSLGLDDFFEEDEPVADVIAAFKAGEQHLTEPPADGAGWCAPSP